MVDGGAKEDGAFEDQIIEVEQLSGKRKNSLSYYSFGARENQSALGEQYVIRAIGAGNRAAEAHKVRFPYRRLLFHQVYDSLTTPQKRQEKLFEDIDAYQKDKKYISYTQ